MTRHPFRPGALLLGVLVLAGVAGWFLHDLDVAGARDLAVAGAVALILAGAAGIALTFRRTS
ncbi:MAG: hypothetical protein PGN07_02845 [Aeromicrobium erythreum]